MSAPRLPATRVLVTRPRSQSTRLAERIAELGGRPVVLPAIDIVPLPETAWLQPVLETLDAWQLAIFVSANAVECSLPAIRQRRPWPTQLPVAAIGSGTARALRQHGLTEVHVPERSFDSEAVLELPLLQDVAGRRVGILRGRHGRELLGETLRQRGAAVQIVECYERRMPDTRMSDELMQDLSDIDASIVTSLEGLFNLFQMLPERLADRLREAPLFATHTRIASGARALGLRQVVETTAEDEALLASLIRHFARAA